MIKGKWIQSDIPVNKGETLLFFHPADGSGQSWIALGEDGTVEFSGNRDVVIRNVGTTKEKVVVKNAADVVV